MAGKHRKNSNNSQQEITFPDVSGDAFEGSISDTPKPEPIIEPVRAIKPRKSRRMKWILGILASLLLAAGVAGFAYAWLKYPGMMKDKLSLLSGGIVKAPPKVTFCPLDGRSVSNAADIKRRPLLIKVENISDARPQSGLDSADVVLESMAEGGITRFAAVYLCRDAGEVGPIRSARLQDIDFIAEYDALFAHVGGSDAYAASAPSSIADLDQFFNEDAYDRVEWRDMPHNVYTSTKRLRDLATTLGSEREAAIQSLMFGIIKPRKGGTTIDIPYPSECDVHYSYDSKTKTYLRNVAGQPHNDKVTGKQLAPANVIVQYVEYLSSYDGEDYGMGERQTMEVIGSGRALIFTVGGVTEATWSRGGRGDRTVYYDLQGQPVRFNRGQIWIEFVPSNWTATYS